MTRKQKRRKPDGLRPSPLRFSLIFGFRYRRVKTRNVCNIFTIGDV
jgi:hypothetical protein